VLDLLDPNDRPGEGGTTYVVEPGSPKYDKIASAAVIACMPISPSRDLGLGLPGESQGAAEIIKALYQAMVPGSDQNPRIPRRLENKLAYALQATQVEVRFYHTHRYPEPPLVSYPHLDDDLTDFTVEFMPNEIGWQDLITVTVRSTIGEVGLGRSGCRQRAGKWLHRGVRGFLQCPISGHIMAAPDGGP